MANFNFPLQRPGLQPGGLLRGLAETGVEPVTPPPEVTPGTPLRERVEEPLEREQPLGVEQSFLESPTGAFLAQLESNLRAQQFSPEEAATLIDAIIAAPATRSVAGRRAVRRGPIGGPKPRGKKAQGVTVRANLRFPTAKRSTVGGRGVRGGPIGRAPVKVNFGRGGAKLFAGPPTGAFPAVAGGGKSTKTKGTGLIGQIQSLIRRAIFGF